jgi:two-component system LytT family response regulator
MLSAIIIDDQQESIDDLKYLIEKNEIPVQVISTATSGNDGLAAILKYKPQILFLDIVMPGMSGFEMLGLLPQMDFHLIITSSVDKYAIQAIRSSALDFLLKPVKSKELEEAINRSITKLEKPQKEQLDYLSDTLRKRPGSIRRIAISISEGIELIAVDDIYYFESDGNYTTLHLKGNRQMLVSKAIGKFEEIVDNEVFFRLHNSFLVNLNHISVHLVFYCRRVGLFFLL